MKLFKDLQRTVDGAFVRPCNQLRSFESRQERQRKAKAKRRKQLMDSLNSIGCGYHKQQGWFK